MSIHPRLGLRSGHGYRTFSSKPRMNNFYNFDSKGMRPAVTTISLVSQTKGSTQHPLLQ